jgi:hypothetical protein
VQIYGFWVPCHSALNALQQIFRIVNLTPFATSQPHSLPILLELGDELISLLHNICVLLVLVIWTISLDDAVHSVDGAGYAISGNELGKVPSHC